MSKTIKIVSWNVNGIRACLGHGFTDVLATLNPDLMCLQEIKIDSEARAKADFDFPNYEEYFNPAVKKGYSGTGLLSREKIPVKTGLGIEEFDHEGRVQTAELPEFFLVNVYFPNSQADLKRLSYKEHFNEAMIKYLKKLEATKPVIICGDFNVAREDIDLARPKANVGNAGFTDEERYWGREFLKAGFVDTFRHLYPDEAKYSWWSYRGQARRHNVGWRIDYFLVSASISGRIKDAWIKDNITGSDHAPIGLEIVF